MTSAPESTALDDSPTSSLAKTSPPDPLRGIRFALAIIAIIIVVATVTYLGRILEQVLIALFLYFAISPAPRALARRGVPSWLTYLLLLFLAGILAILVGRMLQANTLQFLDRLPRYQAKIEHIAARANEEDARTIGKMFSEATSGIVK